MKTKILRFSLFAVVCLSFSLTAQAQRDDSPNIKLLPDLRVKSVKLEWFEIKGRGFYLQITPTVQKNKADKINTEADKPVIISVSTLLTGATPGPTCELKVSKWTSEETEKSFGTCTLKFGQYQTPIGGLVKVDNGNRVAESDESNNNHSIQNMPPKPSN